MKTKLYPYIIGAVVVTAIAIGIYYSETSKPKSIVPVEIEDKSNLVFNFTSQSYYDTIILTGLQILGIQDVGVTVEPLSDKAKENFAKQGGELAAHLREYYGSYYLYIDPAPLNEAIDVIAHELIHLKQYNTSELVFKNDTLTWRNKIYERNELSYGERPWEIDADEKGNELAKQIKEKLY